MYLRGNIYSLALEQLLLPYDSPTFKIVHTVFQAYEITIRKGPSHQIRVWHPHSDLHIADFKLNLYNSRTERISNLMGMFINTISVTGKNLK